LHGRGRGSGVSAIKDGDAVAIGDFDDFAGYSIIRQLIFRSKCGVLRSWQVLDV